MDILTPKMVANIFEIICILKADKNIPATVQTSILVVKDAGEKFPSINYLKGGHTYRFKILIVLINIFLGGESMLLNTQLPDLIYQNLGK